VIKIKGRSAGGVFKLFSNRVQGIETLTKRNGRLGHVNYIYKYFIKEESILL